MPFINTIPDAEATGDVRRMYEENRMPDGRIPNYVQMFSHRPDVMEIWGNLLGAIKTNLDPRRYELATLAAARTLRHSYCMLAHSLVLCEQFYSQDELLRIATDYRAADLDPADVAIMAYAEQVVRDATAITQADIDTLKQHGLSDAEIFDLTTAITVRCFFSKALDALGVQPDGDYLELDEQFYKTLAVGRPIDGQNPT
ncbi:MAG: carboxymuconolactone decarboxylase family protein [Anaerolineae bacterium]|nr:carboxymuconolactone decarboxylase family protein [Anaerolineae bacterium]